MSASPWISIKDRLPTDPGFYIVCAASADPENPLICKAWFEPDGTGNMPGWQLMPKVWIPAITHWMPMPTPPDQPNDELLNADNSRSIIMKIDVAFISLLLAEGIYLLHRLGILG